MSTDNFVLPLDIFVFDQRLDFSIIGIVIYTLIFIFSTYSIYRNRINSNDTFDLALKLLICIFLTSRLLGVLNNFELYFSDLYSILNIFDLKFLYSGLLLGIIIYILFFNGKLNNKVGFLENLDNYILIYIFSIIPLLLLLTLDGRIIGIQNVGGLSISYNDGITRFPLGFIQVFYNIIIMIFFLFVIKGKTKPGLLSSIYFVVFSTIEFILRYFSSNYDPYIFNFLDLYQIISLVLLIISIYLFLTINKSSRTIDLSIEKENKVKRQSFNINEFKRKRISTKDLYSMSYSSMERYKRNNND